MKKRKFVRLQLLALLAVILLLIYRVKEGPPKPKGLVVFTDIGLETLKHKAFLVERTDTLVITATGSFEGEQNDLAAYGWVLRRDDRSVVWHMEPGASNREKKTLATVEDTIVVNPGTYDTYFTAYGSRLNPEVSSSFWETLTSGDNAWRNDQRKWSLVLRPLQGGKDNVLLIDDGENNDRAPQGEGLLWTSAPMEGRSLQEYLFETHQPVTLRLYAVGEIESTAMDYGWIENLVTGERNWEMTLDNTEPAGGWEVNRLYKGTIDLEAGVYRAAYITDPRQSYRDWTGNPPFDPAGWGLSLFSVEDSDVISFDPWSTRQPIVRLSRVTNDQTRSAKIQVVQPTMVLVSALGEMTESSKYDYGWMTSENKQEIIWEMNHASTQWAGGDDSNRLATSFIRLEPGTYTVTFKTDGSHAYNDWSNGSPDHPERWGITLFSASMVPDSNIVLVAGTAELGSAENAVHGMAGPPPPALGEGEQVLELTRIGNEAVEEVPFVLEEDAQLHIYAVGEISMSGRYDYGRIDRESTGETVWEMTWENTRHAGGEDRNRLFDGVIDLGAGRYVMHFMTDFSHAYGDFSDRGPDVPERWGITIEKL